MRNSARQCKLTHMSWTDLFHTFLWVTVAPGLAFLAGYIFLNFEAAVEKWDYEKNRER